MKDYIGTDEPFIAKVVESIHRDSTTLKTLTDALGPHVIKVLKRADRAAEYLANWKVQCHIEDNRCTVLRDGVVIGVGYYA